MLKIRLQRIGRRNNPSYRVVAVDSRAAAKKGKTVELLGSYDPIRKTQKLNTERILFRLSQGAQVSDTVHNLLVAQKVIEGKKKNVLPKRRPIAKQEEKVEENTKTEEKNTQETTMEQQPQPEENTTVEASTESSSNQNPSNEG